MPTQPKQNKKASGSKGRASSATSGGKRPSPISRKPLKSKPEGVLARIQRPRFLPFLAVWLLAIAVLAGLVYWGDNSKSTAPKVRGKIAATARQSEDRASPPPKPAGPKKASSSTPKAPATGWTPFPRAEPRPVSSPVKPPADEAPRPSQTDEKKAPGWTLFPHVQPQPAPNPPTPSSDEAPRPSKTDENISIALAPQSLPKSPAPPPTPPGPPLPPALARVAIVIDDFGGDVEIARKFLALPFPVTLSVLPHLRHSREVASLAHAQGHEVMLHLPMQPIGYPKTDPGKGALLLTMSQDQIAGAVEAAIESCPHLAGVNNHMGSKFTEDPERMKMVLQELDRRKLFFLDSHTSPRSVGYSMARDLHVPSLRRDVFLDNTETEEAIQGQLVQLIKKARIQGSAVAIGHTYESTCNVLSRAAALFRKEGITVVPASQLIKGVNR